MPPRRRDIATSRQPGTPAQLVNANDPQMLYMIIEKYRNADPRPVYQRFSERGRLAPGGLEYLGSWITDDLKVCYQVMRCDERALLEEWMSNWNDIVDFEVIPVITSAEARERALYE